MVQTHDVFVNGQGYMLLLGSYKYESVGAEVSRFSTGVPAFDQRLGRGPTLPQSDDRDGRRWSAVGMVPVPIGLGDEPGRLMLGPKEQNTVAGASFDLNSRIQVYNGVVYISLGVNLFKVTTVAGAFSTLTFIGAAGGTITSMCVSGGLLYMATTAAGTMSNYAGAGAIANAPAAAAQVVWDFARGLWRSKKDPGNNEWSIASGSADGGATWTDFHLDSTIRSAIVWRGRATGGGTMLIGTAGMLWELSGQWTGAPAVFSGTVNAIYDGRGGGGLDDFNWLVEHEGYVYTWFAGTVCRWNGQRLEPIDGGPRGQVQGMCVAGGWLCVSVNDPGVAGYQIWCYDGVRWFVLVRSATPYGTLGGSQGLVSDAQLFSLNWTTSHSRWQLPVGTFQVAGNTAASGQVYAGPLDAGAGDVVKTWTGISVPWSTILFDYATTAPANPGGNLLAEYSLDDGSNFVSLGNVTIAAAARSGLASWVIPNAGVQANRLLIRITWTPTSAYAGLQINGVFAAGWKVAAVPRHERWTLKLRITDRMIRRDGAVDARSGETQLQALRALAQSGGTFVFQDIDYDLNARNITCRIADIEETERKGDGTHFLESTVKVLIEAVA
jgi:hypothetical protein